MLATAFILKRRPSLFTFVQLAFYMSGKNSKTTIALGLLTIIFLFARLNWLFCPIQLAFLHDSIGFFVRFNWLFDDSIGFF